MSPDELENMKQRLSVVCRKHVDDSGSMPADKLLRLTLGIHRLHERGHRDAAIRIISYAMSMAYDAGYLNGKQDGGDS